MKLPASTEFSKVKVQETNQLRDPNKFSPANWGSDPRSLSDSMKMVKWAKSGRNGWAIVSEATDEDGNWTVEFHRCHPNDRSRRTFFR